MKMGVVSSSDLAKYGRMDAGFMLLMSHHRAAVDELLEKFTRDELATLGGKLPLDADAVFVVAASGGKQGLGAWLDRKATPATDLAVYCAVAAASAASKLAAALEKRRRDDEKATADFAALLGAARDKGAVKLYATLTTPAPDAPPPADATDVA